MPTGSVRAEVRARLLDRLRSAPTIAGVQVEPAVPAELAHEHVVFGFVTGSVEVRVMTAGRKHRADTFTVGVWIMAGRAGQNATTAEARALELLDALDGILADDPTLGGVAGLVYARLGTVDGPDLSATDGGYVAAVNANVDCLAHYT